MKDIPYALETWALLCINKNKNSCIISILGLSVLTPFPHPLSLPCPTSIISYMAVCELKYGLQVCALKAVSKMDGNI